MELASCDTSGVWNFEVGPRVFQKFMYPCFSVYVTIKIFLFCEVCHYWVAVQCVEDLAYVGWGSASHWCVYVVCLSPPFSLASSGPKYLYLLTPWCRVLLEQLTGLQLVKKFPTFHGTRRFITALTSVRHLSLSWASPIKSVYPHPTSWRSILILSTHLHLVSPVVSFPPVSPPRPYTPPLSSPIHATCPAHLILLDFITRTILGEEYRSFSSSLCNQKYLYSSQSSIEYFFKETSFWRSGRSATSFCNFSCLKLGLVFKQNQQIACFVL